MTRPPAVADLFRSEARADYDFTAAPAFVRLASPGLLDDAYGMERTRAWARAQQVFIRWTRERRVFTNAAIRDGRAIYDQFFSLRGPLTGSVLDIGGGWGLYREWWRPSSGDVFVVHDPGVERFHRGPHALHKAHYRSAFTRPMTFVEGFGEMLPYESAVFDHCLIAASLDHCLDPATVLRESHRILRPRGVLTLLQECHAEPPATAVPVSFIRRIRGALRRPRATLASVWIRTRYPDVHLHHFLAAQLVELLRDAGFSEVRMESGPGGADSFCFLAIK